MKIYNEEGELLGEYAIRLPEGSTRMTFVERPTIFRTADDEAKIRTHQIYSRAVATWTCPRSSTDALMKLEGFIPEEPDTDKLRVLLRDRLSSPYQRVDIVDLAEKILRIFRG